MHGFFLRHQVFGFGKVIAYDHALVTIRFPACPDGLTFETRDIGRIAGLVARAHLPAGTRCVGQGQNAVVARLVRPPSHGDAAMYELDFPDGITRTLSE